MSIKPYWWKGGGIQLYCGDAREIVFEIASDVNLVITDPPYGIDSVGRDSAIGGDKAVGGGGRIVRARKYAGVVGDLEPFDPAWLLRFAAARRAPAILWGGNHYADRLPPSASWLVWDKREGSMSDNFADCELAWTNLGGPARLFSYLWRGCMRRGRGSPWEPERVYPN